MREPSHLLVLARFSRPGELLRIASRWAQHRVLGVADVARFITAELGGKLIDLDKTLDVAATTDGWAVSLAVTSMADARASFPPKARLVPGDNGALRIDGLFDLEEYGSASLHTCELAPAAGPVATRLVCASNEQTLATLAPYLTRTVAPTLATADVHVEARLDRSQGADADRTLPPLLGDLLPRSSDPGWLDLVQRLTGEVLYLESDVDRFTLDGTLEEGSLALELRATFANAKSQTARMLLGHPERAVAPPGAFWRLPASADFALFDRGLDNERIEHARDLVLRLLSDGLDREQLDEADREGLMTALRHLLTTPSPAVFARGVDFEEAKRAVEAAVTDSRAPARRRATAATVGWWMEGLEEPAARVQGAMAELVRAWNRPGVQAWAKRQDSHPPTLALEPVPATLKLPRGSTLLVLGVPSESSSIHLFAVPDAGRVWLALGMDSTLLADRLRDVVGPASPTLDARPALEPMKGLRVSSGGFVTLRGVWTTLPDALGAIRPQEAKTRYAAVARLTDQGATPLIVTWSSVAPSADAAAGSVVLTLRVDRALVEGLAHLEGSAQRATSPTQ